MLHFIRFFIKIFKKRKKTLTKARKRFFILFTKSCNGFCKNNCVLEEVVNRKTFVCAVHIVNFAGEFRAEGNTALYLVNISTAANGNGSALGACHLAVYSEQCLNEIGIFINLMCFNAVCIRKVYTVQIKTVGELTFYAFKSFTNGETAIEFFINSIGEESLYLLDEPENSLSAEKQLELASFIANSARGEHNQFIIATHSPLLLALPGAKIYDLDQRPVKTVPWYELENPRIYYAFFKQYEHCFKIKEQ